MEQGRTDFTSPVYRDRHGTTIRMIPSFVAASLPRHSEPQ
jgi:hypothetical protein